MTVLMIHVNMEPVWMVSTLSPVSATQGSQEVIAVQVNMTKMQMGVTVGGHCSTGIDGT